MKDTFEDINAGDLKEKKIILFILGTRPEIIKLFVLYRILKDSEEFLPIIINTGQQIIFHDILTKLNLKYDFAVPVLENRSPDLIEFSTHLLKYLNEIFSPGTQIPKNNISAVIVQGDTISSYCGAVWSFLNGIPVFHVEAGLRTFDHQNPFPEEFNRESISRIASLNFAPTEISYSNLIREGIGKDKIHIVGNTVNDAIVTFINESKIKDRDEKETYILSTLHRRENWDKVENYSRILGDLSFKIDSFDKLYHIIHPNPELQKNFYKGLNDNYSDKLEILDPINDYFEMLGLVKNSSVILTDSGGMQEESLFFNIPCGILRKVTERPEVLKKNAKLIRFDLNEISQFIKSASIDISIDSSSFDYTYGEGDTSRKIYRIMKEFFT